MNAVVRKRASKVTRIRPDFDDAEEALRSAQAAHEAATAVASAVSRIEDRLGSVDARIEKLVSAMENMARIEERQIAIKDTIERNSKADAEKEDRLRKIETALPSLLEVRKWIIVGVCGILGLAGMAGWDAIINPAHRVQQPVAVVQAPPTVKPATE